MYDVSRLSTASDWPLITRVAGILGPAGAPFLVGGWLRDALLGRDVDDIDFAVSGDGVAHAESVARVLGGTCVLLDARNGIARVVLPFADSPSGRQLTLDFAGYVTIEEDLARRDFTVDAMAVDLAEAGGLARVRLMDPYGGLDDLKRKVIRATSGSIFSSDPARLIRGVRLAGELTFTIEPATESLIRENAALISRVAGERIREELVSILRLTASGHLVAYMERLGLLTRFIPELEDARGVSQPREHHWDVLAHCVKTVEAFDYLLKQGEWPFASAPAAELCSPDVDAYFEANVASDSSRAALFRLAALLHDVSKPDTKTIEATGRMRFLGHGEEGAGVSARVLERLRFANREIKLVETAVKYHLRPTQMGWPQLPTPRALYRYYRDTGEAAVGIVFLSLADHMAARGPGLDPEDWREHVDISRHILSQRAESPGRLHPLIDGYDIMKSFSLRPGRRVGELLESLREAQAAGEISSREEALAMVRRLLEAPVFRDKDRSGQSG